MTVDDDDDDLVSIRIYVKEKQIGLKYHVKELNFNVQSLSIYLEVKSINY